MPKLDLKTVQKELQQKQLWPVYWIYGPEKMKVRELLKQLRTAVQGEPGAAPSPGFGAGFGEENLDGSEVDGSTIVDAANSMSLGGGVRFVVVKEAEHVKDVESISALFGKRQTLEELPFVLVCIAKDLDARKKISKQLVEHCAVIECAEVLDDERETWIHYLAKRKKLELHSDIVLQLCSLDPWSLDSVDQELEKFSLTHSAEALLGNAGGGVILGEEDFCQAFFSRDLKKTLQCIEGFAYQPEEAFKLLGLFAWNLRHLSVFVKEQGRPQKMNPYLAEKLRKWGRLWTLEELVKLTEALGRLDFELKQTATHPLGGWSSVAMRFCR